MLAGFLLVLKIIGIILLLILGLILLALAVFMLVPLRYSFYFKEEQKKISWGVRASWLLKLVKVFVRYKDEKLTYKARLAWKTLLTNIPDTKEGKKEKESETKKEEVKEAVRQTEKKQEEKKIQEKKTDIKENKTDIEEKKTDIKENKTEKKEIKTKETRKKEEKKEEAGKTESPPPKKKKEKKKKKDSRKQKEEDGLIGTAREFPLEAFRTKGLKHVTGLIRHILPNKLSGYLLYGFDDPSVTGTVTGAAASFYPLYAKSLRLYPDFMHKILEGEISGSGRIRFGYVTYAIVRLMMIKEIRSYVFKLIKN